MPELSIEITGVQAEHRGITPLLQFHVVITNTPPEEEIRAISLQAQVQIQALQRAYTETERERMVELFGAPERWGQTLHNQPWTQALANVPPFRGSTTATLSIPCTFDVHVNTAKYFYALESGDVSLLFLFSGSVFYPGPAGHLQVERISWEKESVFRMPVAVWREMMDCHYPNCAWLYLDREVFERLYAYKRAHGIATWEETIDRLLPVMTPEGALP